MAQNQARSYVFGEAELCNAQVLIQALVQVSLRRAEQGPGCASEKRAVGIMGAVAVACLLSKAWSWTSLTSLLRSLLCIL